MQATFIFTTTALTGLIGWYLGATIHGPSSPAVLIPALSGAAGGFGIGYAALSVIERLQRTRQSPL